MSINMTVRAINNAVVYDIDGARIPEDQFVSVPLSAAIVTAVKAGDLEEAEEKDLPHRVIEAIARHELTHMKTAPPKPRKPPPRDSATSS